MDRHLIRKQAIERRLKGKVWQMQEVLDNASQSGELREGSYMAMCDEVKALFADASEFTDHERHAPVPALTGSAEQRTANIDMFFTQRALDHNPIWMDPMTNHGGEEVIAQLENALKYYMARAMRLENQNDALWVRLRDELSQHMRYNALKGELSAMLSATFLNEIKEKARKKAIGLMKVRLEEMDKERQATQQAERVLWEEASDNSHYIERWARKATDLLKAEGQTEQDRAYAAMILRNLKDRSGLSDCESVTTK